MAVMTLAHSALDIGVYYPLLKDFGGGGVFFWCCLPEAFLSVRLSRFSVRTHILVMDFQILWSPPEDFEGDIVLVLSVLPSSLTKGALWSHLPPATDQVERCQLLAKIWGKHWLWHPGRSLKDWLPLKWPKNNGVKPHTDKYKQVAHNRQ